MPLDRVGARGRDAAGSMGDFGARSKVEVRRIHASARTMSAAQEGILTLQKLKSTGPQSVTVHYDHVHDGGQAVVESISTNKQRESL